MSRMSELDAEPRIQVVVYVKDQAEVDKLLDYLAENGFDHENPEPVPLQDWDDELGED